MSIKEGSTEAPIRHAIKWQDDDFHDMAAIEQELTRVFDICHGCRRCFNLCDSFPKLFDLIDESETGELDSVSTKEYKPIVDACTLCDMCFMTKCPYVPPHEFDLDFPHLMLRYRAAEHRAGETGFMIRQLTATDRNGSLAARVAPLANWASATSNALTRVPLEAIAGVHRDASLPEFHSQTFEAQARSAPPDVAPDAPAASRKAVLYATCFVNYNNPLIGTAAQGILAKNGVQTEVVYPGCCGMPQFEQGDLADVAGRARHVAAEMSSWIDSGHTIVALTPSCALMLKFEWPLLLPDDDQVAKLAAATMDITEYIVDIARSEGLAPGLGPLDGGVALHFACHAQAQNMGPKAADMLRLIPDIDLQVIERCSGHGGSWGILKENFDTAIKVGTPAARQVVKSEKKYVASECPLAGEHLLQTMTRLDAADIPEHSPHPVELFAKAYGLNS
jgi:glycerol-3-phosphate dehydrogenase subunit C